MKILLIANFREGTGGISHQVETLKRKLHDEGICSEIFSLKANVLGRLFLSIKLLFVGKDYDIFHIHACSYFGFFPAIIGVSVGNFLHKRVVLTYHGGGASDFFTKHKKLVNFFLSRTDCNIVLSGYLAGIFEENKIKCVNIPNVLEFNANYFKRRDVLLPNYISVRTLSPDYNVQCIIKAFKSVSSVIQDATLTILSDGPLKNELQDLVFKEKLQNVTFVGQVPNSEIYSYLDRADVLVSAPLVDNQPISLLEAFSAGLLVVSSNVGGVPYMIKNGENGMLFDSNNSEQLAEAMISCIQYQDKSKRMILNAKNELSYYSWENIKDKLFNVYFTSI